MAANDVPFSLSKREYQKLFKIKPITNWTTKMNKKRNHGLVFEYWTSTGPAEPVYRHGNVHYKGSAGTGYTSGAKDTTVKKFEKNDIDVKEVHYEPECDSWILKDTDGNYHRAPWANCYRNPSYPHHASRDEVNNVFTTCTGLTVWP